MKQKFPLSILALLIAMSVVIPQSAAAYSGQGIGVYEMTSLIIFGLFAGIIYAFSKLGMGVLNVSLLKFQNIASIEKHQPFLPSARVILGTVTLILLLFLLSLKTVFGIPPFTGPYAWHGMAIFLTVAGCASVVARELWPQEAKKYIFAVAIGTAMTFILLGFKRTLFDVGDQNPVLMALGVVCVYLTWRLLFGPWRPLVKSVVLGTFIFWVTAHQLFSVDQAERVALLLTVVIALIPALVWCFLFLGYHKQRISVVLLMFFSGMLSTAPILFYDKMVRSGVELNFFLFRLVPESFTRSSKLFVTQSMHGITSYHTVLMSTFISFMIVGLIEEMSKFWVLKKSGKSSFASIDEVMQLAIIVAIGFAFAENILNPTYFLAFVREYLVRPEVPNWMGFLGNVLGRSILTNMVHIVSTGVLGYFFGIALFAKPYLEDDHKKGEHHFIAGHVSRLFRIEEPLVFARQMVIAGVLLSIVVHGMFNFLVTLPDIIPGNPRTLGDVLGMPDGSFTHYIAFLIVPSLFYVVGGFWLLSTLFYKKEAMKERGHIVRTDTFVTTPA